MSQQEIADRLGVSQAIVSAWLRGRRHPSPEHRARIVALLGPDALPEVKPLADAG